MSKLKGSSNAIRIKHIVLLFIASVVIALPLRTYQLLIMVNPENGFFENGNFAVPALYIAAFAFSALFIVFSFFSKGVPAPRINEDKNILLGTASVALSIGFVWDLINVIQTITPQIMYSYSYGYGYDSYASKELITAFIKENGGIFIILQLVFAVLSALYFLIFGVSYFEGKATYKKVPLMSLSPVIWGMSILISKLMKPVSFITVSELLFEIFAFVFVMIFFFTFARVSTGVFVENGMWSVFGCGFAAALFGGIITIPRLVMSFVGRPAVDGHEFNFTYFVVTVFIVVALFSILGAGFKNGFKGFSGFSDFSLDNEDEIMIKSNDTIVVEEEEIVENATVTQVETVSDDEINAAMKNLFQKASVVEKSEKVIEEIIEEEPEEVVEEIVEEEPEEIVEEKDEFLAWDDMVIGDEDEEEIDEPEKETKISSTEPEKVETPVVQEAEASVEVKEKQKKAKKEKPEKKKQEKIKKEKTEKKRLFGKNKKQEIPEEDASLKPISLAELRKKETDTE